MSMGLENVIEKIQKEGTEKVTAIISDAEHQAAQILKNRTTTTQGAVKEEKTRGRTLHRHPHNPGG
jgi:vacuolar-type H+-ATPase subunit E/Vma4